MLADIEALLIPWLNSRLPARALTVLPDDLQQVLPVVQVARIGGADDQPALDAATVDVDYFAADRASASLLARQGHQALRRVLPGLILTAGSQSATITRVTTVIVPRWTYYDASVERYTSTHQIWAKTRIFA